jgi:hypothetical protein
LQDHTQHIGEAVDGCQRSLTTMYSIMLPRNHASSPSANLFAMSIRSDTVFGLILPISLTRSPRRNPSVIASIALSSKTLTVEFLMMLHLRIYDLMIREA